MQVLEVKAAIADKVIRLSFNLLQSFFLPVNLSLRSEVSLIELHQDIEVQYFRGPLLRIHFRPCQLHDDILGHILLS
jgi:hypothetical protein